MKFPLEWHRQNVRNMRVSRASVQREFEHTLARIAYLDQAIELRTAQIAEAERRGLAEFDHEKLLIARAKSKEI